MDIPVRNPRTGEMDYHFTAMPEQDLVDMLEAIRKAQLNWQVRGIEERIAVLEAWQSHLIKAREEIIEALVSDTGRYGESVLEFDLLPASLQRWIGWARDFFGQPRERRSAVPHVAILQDHVPYPLVSVISPWNFPLLLSVIDTLPALLAGSAVVVKPSEITPRFIPILQRTIAATPGLASVLRYVAGDGHTGQQLVTRADLTCFTGSVETGRKVLTQAAAFFRPCFLELGGKDAALVLEGARLDHAAQAILWGSTVNSGQSCLSVERVYVQESIFPEFVAKLRQAAAKVRLCAENPRDGHLGPVISQKQVEIINTQLQDALEKGATLICGDAACVNIHGGYYCRPTILTGVNHGMKIMREETFGPIMPVMPFRNVEEGIALANDSLFGLSGAVFAANRDIALGVGKRLEAGAISINECALTAIVHEGEKNAFRFSGLGGTRMGPASMQRFMRRKAYLINENKEASPWWFQP